MSKRKDPQKEEHKREKKTVLGSLISKQEPDEDYLPDLRKQWEAMIPKDRIRFVLGAVLGLILFFGALVMVYFLLSAIAG